MQMIASLYNDLITNLFIARLIYASFIITSPTALISKAFRLFSM